MRAFPNSQQPGCYQWELFQREVTGLPLLDGCTHVDVRFIQLTQLWCALELKGHVGCNLHARYTSTSTCACLVPFHQVAIPVVPTVRVQVTFSEFRQAPKAPAVAGVDEAVEFQDALGGGEAEVDEGDDFHTPTGSPERGEGSEGGGGQSSSWLDWMRRKGGGKDSSGLASHGGEGGTSGRLKAGVGNGLEVGGEDVWAENPFVIPPEYRWVNEKEKRRREKEKRRQQKQAAKKASDLKRTGKT